MIHFKSHFKSDTTHSYLWPNYYAGVYGVTLLRVWHGSFIRVTRLIYMRDSIHTLARRSRVTWLTQMCDTIHSNVWHDWVICVIWLMCATGSLMFIYVTWLSAPTRVIRLIHMCDVPHSCVSLSNDATRFNCFLPFFLSFLFSFFLVQCTYVWHDSYIFVIRLSAQMCGTTHSYLSYVSVIRVTWQLYAWHDTNIINIWLRHVLSHTCHW